MQTFRTFSSLFIQQILHIRSPHTTPPSLTDRQFHPIREHERLLVHTLDLVHIDQNTVIALKKPLVTSESLHRPLICIGTRKANTLLCKRNMQPSAFDIDIVNLIQEDFKRLPIMLNHQRLRRLGTTFKHACKSCTERLFIHAHRL